MSYAEPKDPTRPADLQQEVQNNKPVLSAIIVSSQRRIAVINGHIFREGDEFEGIKVLAIESNSVEVEDPSGKEKLILIIHPIRPID